MARHSKFVISLAIGIAAGLCTWWARADLVRLNTAFASDFAQLWHAAIALQQGIDPYSVVGPGKAFDWRFPLLYPLPAVLVALPFSYLPLPWAEALFVGIGSVGLASALLERNRSALWAFYSFAMFRVCSTAQWSPLITASALTPSIGFLLACKPTIGVALWCAYPSGRALISAGLFTALSVLIWPSWVGSWLAALPSATHMIVPALEWHSGGPVLLLSAVAWRRPEGRLLLALSCVPQTPVAYEVIPLFLLARTFWDGAVLAMLTVFWQFGATLAGPSASYADAMAISGQLEVALIYLPSLGIVLRQAYIEPRCGISRTTSTGSPDVSSSASRQTEMSG